MSTGQDSDNRRPRITRRGFIGTGGAFVAGSLLPTAALRGEEEEGQKKAEAEEKLQIRQYRTYGRTGFKISDISMGGTRNQDAAVFRYAYESGINHFDTAERYINGRSEIILSEALRHMDRKKIFITTKLHIDAKETEKTITDRFRKCLGRLKTDYVDSLFMHAPSDVDLLDHEGFHSAADKLKAEGRLKYIGVSSHGSRGRRGASMDQVLCAAAEDGRFDTVLVIYNFMNKEAGEKVIAACKKNNVGVSAMKTAPGALEIVPVDPENLTDEQKELIEQMEARGYSKEQAVDRLKRRVKQQEDALEKTKPFAEKYGIETDDRLHQASIQWVLNNEDVHTVCVSFGSFDMVDKIVPISGKELSLLDGGYLRDYERAFGDRYCRHGCDICTRQCPAGLPVATIMRYAYYFACQGREKDAMRKYARLDNPVAAHCATCNAPCARSCPHGVDVQAHLFQAHSLMAMV
jgi:predicted aldo/keto reductase-like oxidoreductase